jgi:hypothetical protein
MKPHRVRGLPSTGRDAPAPGVIDVGSSPASSGAGPVGVADPLKLCVYATIALLAWVFGPLALLAFAVIGLAGYWRAWRAGLERSKCVLRDTRLVLAYLALLAVAALAGIAWTALSWLT